MSSKLIKLSSAQLFEVIIKDVSAAAFSMNLWSNASRLLCCISKDVNWDKSPNDSEFMVFSLLNPIFNDNNEVIGAKIPLGSYLMIFEAKYNFCKFARFANHSLGSSSIELLLKSKKIKAVKESKTAVGRVDSWFCDKLSFSSSVFSLNANSSISLIAFSLMDILLANLQFLNEFSPILSIAMLTYVNDWIFENLSQINDGMFFEVDGDVPEISSTFVSNLPDWWVPPKPLGKVSDPVGFVIAKLHA